MEGKRGNVSFLPPHKPKNQYSYAYNCVFTCPVHILGNRRNSLSFFFSTIHIQYVKNNLQQMSMVSKKRLLLRTIEIQKLEIRDKPVLGEYMSMIKSWLSCGRICTEDERHKASAEITDSRVINIEVVYRIKTTCLNFFFFSWFWVMVIRSQFQSCILLTKREADH